MSRAFVASRFLASGCALALAGLAIGMTVLPTQSNAAPPPAGRVSPPAKATPPGIRIVAVVDGDVITNDDVESRTRFFALSTGLGMTQEVIDRLRPQIIRQLVDERLRIHAARDQKVVVADKDIGAAIRDIEQRNGMQPGALRQKLASIGVSQRTLVDQIRAQLGWIQLLRGLLADKVTVTPAEIDEQLRLRSQANGQVEYRIGEIFVPIDDPAHAADAQRFAETVIAELRRGAPFPLVAAQFSQSQSALDGGSRGWIQANQMDPEISALVASMPPGAISNPVKVAGGFSIVTLQGKRGVGQDLSTAVSVRELFMPFPTPLNPQAPTDAQRQVVEKARGMTATLHDCDAMEAIAKASNDANHPSNPGELRLESVSPPALRQLLATMPLGKVSQPLIAADGVTMVMVCSRGQKNMPTLSRQDVANQIQGDRIELLSRQILRDLRRGANIDIRGGGA
jgi:peptidyl-prolyl cis-trans isomerase SurA